MSRSQCAIQYPKNIRLGVSACLMGKEVRFDGGHKRSRYITDTLADYFEFVSFCPEVAIGMGTPRQPIRLVGNERNLQAVGVKNTELNVTQPLRDYGQKIAGNMDDLCGFIFKKDSPSCGMARVKVYSSEGMPERSGAGLFAKEIMLAHPLLPVEEEGRLNDADLRDNFIMRVYVYARWKELRENHFSKSALIQFHASHKYLLLAHSTVVYRQLGQLISNLSNVPLAAVADNYFTELMRCLSKPATRKCHTNVLQHLLGYLTKTLNPTHRIDLAETIDAYRRGEYPLVVPVKLLQHHFRIHRNPYIFQQVYLNPHPQALTSRNIL